MQLGHRPFSWPSLSLDVGRPAVSGTAGAEPVLVVNAAFTAALDDEAAAKIFLRPGQDPARRHAGQPVTQRRGPTAGLSAAMCSRRTPRSSRPIGPNRSSPAASLRRNWTATTPCSNTWPTHPAALATWRWQDPCWRARDQALNLHCRLGRAIACAGGLQMSTPSSDTVLQETQHWLVQAVIGLNLCPFAKAVHVKNGIRYVVSEATEPEALLKELAHELLLLQMQRPRRGRDHAADPPAGADGLSRLQRLPGGRRWPRRAGAGRRVAGGKLPPRLPVRRHRARRHQQLQQPLALPDAAPAA